MYFELPARELAEKRTLRERRNIEGIIEEHGGAPDEAFERVISTMEEKVNGQLALIDGISRRSGKKPDDKNNRVIFTIHQHLLKSTGGPQWKDFGKFLVAAGVLPGFKNAKDGQIKPHIKSFEQHHMREAKAIIERVIP